MLICFPRAPSTSSEGIWTLLAPSPNIPRHLVRRYDWSPRGCVCVDWPKHLRLTDLHSPSFAARSVAHDPSCDHVPRFGEVHVTRFVLGVVKVMCSTVEEVEGPERSDPVMVHMGWAIALFNLSWDNLRCLGDLNTQTLHV